MEWLNGLSAWPVAELLRESTIVYATLNAAHIFSIGLLVGSIATLDLRILGAFRAVPLDALAPLSRVAVTGLILAVVTGIALFTVRPVAYAQNPAFLVKIGLVAIGGANALILRASPAWKAACRSGSLTPVLRASAAISLVIWAGAVLAGRWIGFLQ